jgi:Uma2 family endonuclease
MVKELKRGVQYYYDSHLTEEDEMGQTAPHARLIRYLVRVLEWLFLEQPCAIYNELNFYLKPEEMEKPVIPDIAVIKGEPYREVRSWKIGEGEPPPQVVFEVLSEETWRKDVEEKPKTYGEMGVGEYFVYDPHKPSVLKKGMPRLRGWRRDRNKGEMVEIVADAKGQLWSEELESWLVPEGTHLRLYDQEHRLRLTEAEARDLRAREEAAARQAEARRAQILAEKLRSLGINPDEL